MNTVETNPASVGNPGLQALLDKLQPLLDGGRLNNIVDVLSLGADLVDMVDAALVEKLAVQFEEFTALNWVVGNAVRSAKRQGEQDASALGTLALLRLLQDPDPRRGLTLVLRTLQAIGRQC